MDITVTGRKKTVTERFRRHLDEKLEKIPNVAPRVSRVDVVLTSEVNPRQAKESERVEITCYVKRSVVRAEAAADEEYAALDLAMSRLVERLRRTNDKRRISHTGKHRLPSVSEATFGLPTEPLVASGANGASAPSQEADATDTMDTDLGTQGNSPIELRQKVHASAPMSVGQALNEMELLGHDFFLFHDSASQLPSVVYRRRGWSYGVLHLTEDEATAGGHAASAV